MRPLPPGPPGEPAEHREAYGRDPIGFLEQCHRTYGDIFALKLNERGMALVCSPELVKQVYTADPEVVRAGEAKTALFSNILGTSSTLLLDGREHIKRRQLIQPRFRGDYVKAFTPLMRAAAGTMCARMPKNVTFELHPLLHAMGYDIIFEALFRDTSPILKEQLRPVVREFATIAAASPLLMRPSLQVDEGPDSPWGKVAAVVRKARAAVDTEIARRRWDEKECHDIVGLLVAARDEADQPLHESAITDEILTTVVAGHETTSIAIAWMCLDVFTRPDVLNRLREEVRGVSDVEELPYLDAVVKESLRFRAQIPNGSGRLLAKDFELAGYTIPQGWMVSVAFHLLHRRPELFASPDEFSPERFMTGKYSPYEAAPFGGGPRRCLGMPFASQEMKTVMATMVSQLDLRVEDSSARPQWRGMFLLPEHGLRVSLA